MKSALTILISSISLFVYMAFNLSAQETVTGQICVRAFEDTNLNQIRDQAEIPIQQNLIANLLDREGVIINSALIEDSPTRSQGLICFRDLSPNTYTLAVITAAYQPTTDDQLTVTLAEGDLPIVLDFGGQPLFSDQAVLEPDPSQAISPTLERLVVSAIGALTAMVVWVMIGVVIGLFIIRPKLTGLKTDITDPRASSPKDPDALFKPPSESSDDRYEF